MCSVSRWCGEPEALPGEQILNQGLLNTDDMVGLTLRSLVNKLKVFPSQKCTWTWWGAKNPNGISWLFEIGSNCKQELWRIVIWRCFNDDDKHETLAGMSGTEWTGSEAGEAETRWVNWGVPQWGKEKSLNTEGEMTVTKKPGELIRGE